MPKVGMEPIRRNQIRKAAAKVIAKRGFDGATLMHVARTARISTGTINHYYANKLAVLVDALVYVSEWFQSGMRKAVAREQLPADKLRALIRAAIFRRSTEAMMGHAVWIWALSEAIRSKELREVIQERRRLFQGLLADVIAQLDVSNRMSDDDVAKFAAECDAYLCGLAYAIVTGEVKIDPHAVERSLMSMATARVAQPAQRAERGAAKPAARLALS